MPTVALQSLPRQLFRRFSGEIQPTKRRKDVPFSVILNSNRLKFGGSLCSFKSERCLPLIACSAAGNKTSETTETFYSETFQLRRMEKEEGRLHISLDQKEGDNWQLTVGCTLLGKWVLHWGVHYVGDFGSEWDQPPDEMRPPGSIAIKDYAIETPLINSSASKSDGEYMHEVKIDFNCNSNIAAINFVLKDEETGSWYQHRGGDYMVPLVDYLLDGDNVIGPKSNTSIWSGTLGQLFKVGGHEQRSEDVPEASTGSHRLLKEFHEEQSIIKETPVCNSLSISVTECPDTAKSLVYLETDLPGDVVVHWGVCPGRNERWELPIAVRPPNTEVYRNKALRTKMQAKEDGHGSKTLFTLGEEIPVLAFTLKLSDDTWLNNAGDDFYIPLPKTQPRSKLSSTTESIETDEKPSKDTQEATPSTFSDGIIQDIQDLKTDIASDKIGKTRNKQAQVIILQELEKLAAEAYSIFSSTKTSAQEPVAESDEIVQPPAKISSGTGSGFEILCQGFNWESHKSGRWYMELQEKASYLSSMGFTVIWLPPPTESVSPEGYMPKDYYNLNSRYGSIDELKGVVNKFHEVGIKVLGDVVLNHRCAHYQNSSGIWNIFGGPLNWDDRAVVSDDPHFHGRGNKSSGDNFHAAPNIDHSQDFVRRDIKEWLRWLRKDIGYDGWRLDFVRGFWGGYVKDYIDASQPYFAVGEFWDSLSYTYGEMDYNQDAHRQRIVDWINAAGGTAGAFDVTTKGVLHCVLEKCEYWRLSDAKQKPPGVVGWWPSRAVTFIENHDTGSTQGHWRFPSGKEMQGYAYILTHPGTPSVFYDHIYSHYQSEISTLMSFRTRMKLHCRSVVKIAKAERDVYGAIIDDKVAMKIGPGHYEPPSGPQRWSLAVEGKDYKIWEAV